MEAHIFLKQTALIVFVEAEPQNGCGLIFGWLESVDVNFCGILDLLL